MYRVISPITIKRTGENIPAGVLTKLESVTEHTRWILMQKGVIAEVEGPPLAVLPGWAELAEQLAAFGVETVVDLMEADRERLSIGLGVAPADVRAWQEQAEQFVK